MAKTESEKQPLEELPFIDAFEDSLEEDSLLSEDMPDFSDVVIWGTDWTLETIYKQIEKGNIDLNPQFQRRDAWDIKKKSLLIESFIIGMPVPPIILAEKQNEKGKYLVIDGKQRLLSIQQFCTSDDTQFKKLQLKGIKILKDIEGKTYEELDEGATLSLNYKDAFDNQTLRTIVIKNWKKENFLYTMFHRLNTGTLELSSQELRQALHPGPFLTFLNEATAESKAFHKMLKNERFDARMRDVELALRAFAWHFFHKRYDGDFKGFLDTTCKELNAHWTDREKDIKNYFTELEQAIDFTFTVFENRAFSKLAGKYSFNRTLYEMFVYYFSMPAVRNALQDQAEQEKVVSEFKELCQQDTTFWNTISVHFSDINKVSYRFQKIHELLSSIKKIPIPLMVLNTTSSTSLSEHTGGALD